MFRKAALIAVVALVFLIPQSTGSTQSSHEETLLIDLSKQKSPISPYIYGQFIEHLGRCVYGGLWSEMLEDRKFYYPVTGETPVWTLFTPSDRSWDGEGHPYELLTRSPWLILGNRSAVQMDTSDPFAGEHSPRVQQDPASARTGIYQEGLSLVAGKDYTGRIAFRTDSPSNRIAVTLAWGRGAGDRSVYQFQNTDTDYHTHHFAFKAGRSTDNGRLEITTTEGSLWIGATSLMPADNLYGWRTDTVALLKELNSPIYRWPGGNFVSGYNWKDGIGDPDKRPPRKNPAWKGIEPNDVGLHEYLQFCELIATEPFVTVNTGLGDAEMAAQQVEYVNGSVETEMGRLRASKGRQKPWDVKFWAVGNEMYGEWQLGHMPLEEYTKKHNRVVEAMRAKDPTIQPVAVGAVGEWTRTMLRECSNHMDLLSEHIYWQDREDLMEHIQQISQGIRRVADAHRGYREELPSLKGKDIKVALDEWNYWYGANEFGELGVRYFLQDALGIAAGLHEFFRNSDIYWMANYAQTVNVIGAIKTTPTKAEFETTGLVLKLYRNHFGEIPVEIESQAARQIDVAAAISKDFGYLTVGIVNPAENGLKIKLDCVGGALAQHGSKFTITGSDRMSHNDPEEPRQVDIDRQSIHMLSQGINVAPLSVTLISIPLQEIDR